MIYFAGVRWSFLEGTWGCLVLFATAIVKKSPFCFCCCSFVSTVLCGSLRRRLAFCSEKLPNVITRLYLCVDRFPIGNNAQEARFFHFNRTEEDAIEHQVQLRTLFSLAPNQENPFKGATLEQVANILSLQLFLHELLVDDCCVHTELVQSAYIYVNTVACYAAQMLHTEEEINMFFSFDDIGSRLDETQRAWFQLLPRKEAITLSPIHPNEDEKSVKEYPIDVTFDAQADSNKTSFLVTLADIPTVTTFVPGKSDYYEVLKFVRKCENQKSNMRIDQWNDQLVDAITAQYRQHFVIKHTDQWSLRDRQELKEESLEWKHFPPSMLRSTLEKMKPEKDAQFQPTCTVEHFYAYLSANPLVIDWGNRCFPSQHPINQKVGEMKAKFRKTEEYCNQHGIQISPSNHKLMVKTLMQNLQHKGLSEQGTHHIRGQLKGKVVEEQDPFLDVVDMISDDTINKLVAMRETDMLLHSGPSSSSSSSRKRQAFFDTEGTSQHQPKKAKSQSQGSKPPGDDASSKRQYCYGCGWRMKRINGRYRCTRTPDRGCQDDPRQNQLYCPFEISFTGKKWIAAGFKHGIPKDPSITLENAATKRAEKFGSSKSGKALCLSQHTNDLLLTQQLINFDVQINQVHNLRDDAPM